MKMQHKILTWVIISVLFTHILGVNILYGIYAVDKPAFIELFCVNKNKPSIHCNGTCMLSKMEEQQKSDINKPALPDIAQIQLGLYILNDDFKLKNIFTNKIKHDFHYQNFYISQHTESIFKPPILI